LTFDSFLTPAVAGARGSAGARQIVLEAPDIDVHLKVWMDEDHRRMAGQILPRGNEGFLPTAFVHLLRGQERLDSSSTDAFGEFQLAHVPDGAISIQIDLPHITVVSTLDI
jgi:hypothetical protein